MARLIECIPNFSCSKEKDEATYNELVKTAQSVPGCTLFDAQTDGNHNRCVFTLIGSPRPSRRSPSSSRRSPPSAST